MEERFERKYIVEIIKSALELNIKNCEFMKKLYKDNEKAVKTFNKSIKQCKKGLENVCHIEHLDILRAIYGDIVGQISGQLMIGGSLLVSPKLKEWDSSEKGFKEFTDIQAHNREIYQKKIREQQESREIIAKAHEQGKKVEMFYDPATKKVRPVIVESENKA